MATGIPQEVFNEFDQLGLLLGLKRLPEERNPEYKQRLLIVFTQRANATYAGLINGITRSLGLELFDAIEISPVSVSGVLTATDPNIVFSEASVFLYENFADGDDGLEATIDRFNLTASGHFITDLVDQINSSDSFTATIIDADDYDRSMTILNQSMQVVVTDEEIPQVDKIELKFQNLIVDTVFFSDVEAFRLQVFTEAEVDSNGDYFIDHQNGLVTVFTIPTPGTSVRYKYLRIPMTCTASPVIIHNVQDQDFKAKMFEQILTDDGTTENGLVTSLGADLINELLSVVPVYWGA